MTTEQLAHMAAIIVASLIERADTNDEEVIKKSVRIARKIWKETNQATQEEI